MTMASEQISDKGMCLGESNDSTVNKNVKLVRNQGCGPHLEDRAMKVASRAAVKLDEIRQREKLLSQREEKLAVDARHAQRQLRLVVALLAFTLVFLVKLDWDGQVEIKKKGAQLRLEEELAAEEHVQTIKMPDPREREDEMTNEKMAQRNQLLNRMAEQLKNREKEFMARAARGQEARATPAIQNSATRLFQDDPRPHPSAGSIIPERKKLKALYDISTILAHGSYLRSSSANFEERDGAFYVTTTGASRPLRKQLHFTIPIGGADKVLLELGPCHVEEGMGLDIGIQDGKRNWIVHKRVGNGFHPATSFEVDVSDLDKDVRKVEFALHKVGEEGSAAKFDSLRILVQAE